jgi:hypothetical protein
MRWLPFALILQASLCTTAPLSPDARLPQIGGESITGGVLLQRKPLSFALVRLYTSADALVWVGLTDKDGGFATGKLPPAVYRLEIDGWGCTNVQVDHELDKAFGGQVPRWGLVLSDDGFVGIITDTN